MRQTLLMLTITVAACGGDGPSSDLGAPDLAVKDLQISCASSCGSCAPGTSCVAAGAGINMFSATCLTPCQSDVDCTQERSCVAIDSSVPSGRFCLSPTEPMECAGHCDLVPASSACDGDNLVLPYDTIVCGRKYLHCANGCVEDAPDGGADRHARCL
jgi:hypothetical protein